MTDMPPNELERRRPVWDAMSDVFLDIETRWSMPRVALVLVESGYSTDELEAIWQFEIIPECGRNLWQAAGEWALMVVDEEALTARAQGRVKDEAHALEGGSPDGERPLLERMMGAASPIVIGNQWRAILALREALLALPDERRATRAAAWTAFVRVYLAHSLETMASLESTLEDLRGTGESEEALVAAFQGVRPTLCALLVGSERDDEARRAENVRVAIALAIQTELGR